MNKIEQIRAEMKAAFKERDEEIDGLLTALLSRQHILLIGPRGTAKSLMIRVLASAVKGAKYWERLFTRFTTPDEVFGAVKLSALKQDKFERNIDGHLPTANFAFADEIFKSNSSILNSLLTLINERIYHNNGGAVSVPLETMLGASNELPSDESLAALYDRFLLRFKLAYIEEDAAFRDMMNMPEVKLSVQMTFDELHDMQEQIRKIPIPASVLDAIVQIRKELRKEGVIPSDRRYRQAQDVLRAFAFLNGRQQVSTDDIAILKHVLWDEPAHVSVVERVVISVSNPLQRKADELMDAIFSAWKEVDAIPDDDSKKVLQASEATAKINKAKKALKTLRDQMADEDRDTGKVDGYLKKANEVLKERIAKEIMGIGTN